MATIQLMRQINLTWFLKIKLYKVFHSTNLSTETINVNTYDFEFVGR